MKFATTKLQALSPYSVIILCGFPGSGKSTVAKELEQLYLAQHLSSDALREELFQSSRYDQAGHEKIQELSARAYELMYERGVAFVQAHKKVVLDATHLNTTKRQAGLQRLLRDLAPDQICYLLVNPDHQHIELHMRHHELYEDWKRVFGLFLNDWKAGLLSWPDQAQEGVSVYALYDSSEIS